MKTFNNFIKLIKKSPLNFIKGDCHLISLNIDEYPTDKNMDDDFFKDIPPTITFSYKDKFIGEITLEKNMVMSCDFEQNSNLDLDIRENGIRLNIWIKCNIKFPYLGEYGEFLATAQIISD